MGENIIRIDTVLDRIQEGNDYETANDFWQAAYCFGDAMGLLFQLAIDMIPSTEEEERILDLYQAQCREYLHRGRQALVRALVDEDSKDVSDKDGDPKFITLSEDEARKRVQLFSTLFSKELENDVGVPSQLDQELPDISQLSAQQCSLEARLKSLNSSLIPSLKTEEERMQDINRSLKGLGVHVHSHADRPTSTIEIPVSTDDQVANIIAQVKDELTLDIRSDKAELDIEDDFVLSDDDETDDADDTDDQDDEYGDIPKLLNKKLIRNCVVKAQLKLAQLLFLLDAKPTAAPSAVAVPVTTVAVTKESLQDEGSDDDDIDDIDEQRDAMHEKVELDLDQARALLLKANKNLYRAASAWVVE